MLNKRFGTLLAALCEEYINCSLLDACLTLLQDECNLVRQRLAQDLHSRLRPSLEKFCADESPSSTTVFNTVEVWSCLACT